MRVASWRHRGRAPDQRAIAISAPYHRFWRAGINSLQWRSIAQYRLTLPVVRSLEINASLCL